MIRAHRAKERVSSMRALIGVKSSEAYRHTIDEAKREINDDG
jgi:hypothetical protein